MNVERLLLFGLPAVLTVAALALLLRDVRPERPEPLRLAVPSAPAERSGPAKEEPLLADPADPDREMEGTSSARAAIAEGFRPALPRLTSCYERALRRDPSLQGEVTVSFEVERTERYGFPVGVEVRMSPGLRDGDLRRCLVATIEATRFRPITVGGPVTYPLHFEPQR